MKLQLPSAVNYVLRRLNDANFTAYVVGGCLRDFLLGTTPDDYDVATSATPQQVSEVFSNLRVINTGLAHGTITVICEGESIEITTYRADGNYGDHRHPDSVNFSSNVTDDLARRDFTVNALAYNHEDGLIDPFGGEKDVSRRLIRCVGEPTQRFDEDALRILRGLRFASCLAFDIEPNTAAAMRSHKHLLDYVSGERVREEFCKLLLGVNAENVLNAYADVLSAVFPYLANVAKDAYAAKVYRVTVKRTATCEVILPLRLASFFVNACELQCGAYEKYHGVASHLQAPNSKFLNEQAQNNLSGQDTADSTTLENNIFGKNAANSTTAKAKSLASVLLADDFLTRLRFDNLTRRRTIAVIRAAAVPLQSSAQWVKTMFRIYTPQVTQFTLALHLAQRRAQYDDTAPILQLQRQAQQVFESNQCYSLSQLSLKGNDLLALGAQGATVGRTLDKLLDLVIADQLPNSKEELLRRAREIMRQIQY